MLRAQARSSFLFIFSSFGFLYLELQIVQVWPYFWRVPVPLFIEFVTGCRLRNIRAAVTGISSGFSFRNSLARRIRVERDSCWIGVILSDILIQNSGMSIDAKHVGGPQLTPTINTRFARELLTGPLHSR
jgi:hypothetical protein